MKENNLELKNKLFYLPIIFFGIYLVIRLINEANLISIFPLDYTNDISAYIAQLHFLKVCGFHNFCPYWYNGFVAFLFTPPAWYFFSIPIYLLSGNILLSIYISILLMYILGFIAFYLFSKFLKLSKVKSIALFFLFFANPITIGEFLRLGRLTEFFAWAVFIFLFLIVLFYKDKKLNFYFLVFTFLYSLLMLSHFQEFILFNFLLLGLFLIKSTKEKIYIILSSIASCLLASFWLVPFLINISKSGLWEYSLSNWLLSFRGSLLLTNIISFLVVIVFLFLFYINWIDNGKSKQELLFYFPSLILSLLLVTRLIVFIPILKNIAPDPYILYFGLLSMYLFVKCKFSRNINKILSAGFILLVFISVVTSSIHTPWFTKYTPLEEDSLDLLSEVNGRFLIFGSYPTSYSRAYYSYAPIFNNLSSASGWYPHATTKEYLDRLLYLEYGNISDCNEIRNLLKEFNVNEVIAYDNYYPSLDKCGFNAIKKKEKVFLYSI